MAEQEFDLGPHNPNDRGETGGDTTEQVDLEQSGHLDDPNEDDEDDDLLDEPMEMSADEGAPDDIPQREQLQATYNEGSPEVVQGAWRDPITDEERMTAAAVATFDREGSASDYNDEEQDLRAAIDEFEGDDDEP
jgi:hypothetical protein